MAIRYSDGDKIESQILGLLNQCSDLRSTEPIASESYDNWAVRYHLSPERSNLLRHLDFKGLDVLELGAGMGAVSRSIAEQARSLTVVEGTEARFSALRSRLRDLENWSGQVANIQDVSFKNAFDAVCVVGVLEYAELFMGAQDGQSPFLVFLNKAAQALRPGGVLILAIENQLGLKYWNGSAEDHSRRTFDGICGYPAGPSAKTFSRRGLKQLLRESGLGQIDEQFPFPDYKIPNLVMDAELLRKHPALAANLASQLTYENYGLPRVKYFPDLLAAHSVSQAGLLKELTNSFLMIASHDKSSPIRKRLLGRKLKHKELAWHYNCFRKSPTRTVFTKRGPGALEVTKTELRPARYEGGSLRLRWLGGEKEAVLTGTALREELLRKLYFDGWDAAYRGFLDFLRWSLKQWDRGGVLDGKALDAVTRNATLAARGEYQYFDLEWSADDGIAPTWFVMRNVISFGADRESFPPDTPFRALEALYARACSDLGYTPAFADDLQREAEFQSLVSHRGTVSYHQAAAERLLKSPWIPGGYPRAPRLEERVLRGLLGKRGLRAASRAVNLGWKSLRWLRALQLERHSHA